MATFYHTPKSAGKVDIFQRTHLGGGRYFMRLNCKGLQVGDTVNSMNYDFTCDKIIVNADLNGVFADNQDPEMAYFEAEFIYPRYIDGYDENPSSYGKI